jgi:putative transposase
MPRIRRCQPGGYVFHVLNRGNGRMTLFEKPEDYAACERILGEAMQHVPMRILAYCLMPNHWHLVVRPRHDGELGRFMHRVTTTHVRRWHQHRHTSGQGHLYQGTYKSFPVQRDDHLLMVLRYVEGNALRAGLVQRAEAWQWCSLWRRDHTGDAGTAGTAGATGQAAAAAKAGGQIRARAATSSPATDDGPALADWPIAPPRHWRRLVNGPQAAGELEAVRLSIQRNRPFGGDAWQKRTAARLDLESTLRPRGRPRKQPAEGSK